MLIMTQASAVSMEDDAEALKAEAELMAY